MGATEMNAFAALINGFMQGKQMVQENKMKEAAAASEEQSKRVSDQYYQALIDKANREEGYISKDIMNEYYKTAGMNPNFSTDIPIADAPTYTKIAGDVLDTKEKIRLAQEKKQTQTDQKKYYDSRINKLDGLKQKALVNLQAAQQKIQDLSSKIHLAGKGIMTDITPEELADMDTEIKKQQDNLNGFKAAITVYDLEKKNVISDAWANGIKMYGDPTKDIYGSATDTSGLYDPTATSFNANVGAPNPVTFTSGVPAPVTTTALPGGYISAPPPLTNDRRGGFLDLLTNSLGNAWKKPGQ